MTPNAERRAFPVAALTAALLAGFAACAWDGGSERGTTRTYYVAADEVVWDYAPSGRNQITGEPFDSVSGFSVTTGPAWIGRVYRKALYRAYTDSTFSRLEPRSADWEHLGFLGPLLRAGVGDTLRIVFRNNASFPASLHPHGVFYEKSSEGAPYLDDTRNGDKADDGVPPGGMHVYVWPVPERAGPAAHEGSSVMWMYHSHAHEERDLNAGLMGPIIVTRRGEARPDGTPRDVDREFVVSFSEVNENESWYLEENIRRYTGRPDSVRVVRNAFGGISVEPDRGRNFMETMNGLTFNHLPGLTMQVGERVRWYLMASTNFEFHAPHWHGNVVTSRGMRTDVGSLVPMEMQVADMVPDNPGRWLFHCHVADHLRNGMSASYTVVPSGADSRAAGVRRPRDG